jgi:NADH-quinone oxidoreductase subunit L
LGGATMLVGGLMAVLEKDDKKLVAYSTLSQLGLMVFFLGLLSKEIVFFHLLFHAFFKRLLFIVVGFGIFVSFHNQVKFFSSIPFSLFCRFILFITLARIVGVFFLRGFVSKHTILNILFQKNTLFIALIFVIGIFFTRLYS